jgi:hypothetical protein
MNYGSLMHASNVSLLQHTVKYKVIGERGLGGSGSGVGGKLAN